VQSKSNFVEGIFSNLLLSECNEKQIEYNKYEIAINIILRKMVSNRQQDSRLRIQPGATGSDRKVEMWKEKGMRHINLSLIIMLITTNNAADKLRMWVQIGGIQLLYKSLFYQNISSGLEP